MDGNFGRPEDKDIQKEFMRRIRGDKLQTINAECELEICLAFREETKIKNTKERKRRPKERVEEENSVQTHEIQILEIKDLDAGRREILTRLFKKYKQAWVFEELKEDEPLPDHFFDDGCDLSYILFNIIAEEERMSDFTAEELIFLELLCLQGRNHLTQSILKYYKENMEYMVDSMKVGLMKINEKRKEIEFQRSESLKAKENKKNPQEDHISSHFNDTENVQGEEMSASKREKKNKPIKKTTKKKGKGKKEKREQSSENDGEGESEEQKYPEDKELALKTCNYISWAYWYILKK